MSERLRTRLGRRLEPDQSQLVKVFFYTKQSQAAQKLVGVAACLGIHTEGIDLTTKAAGPCIADLSEESQGKCGIVLDLASLKNRYSEEELKGLVVRLRELEVVVLLLVSNADDPAAKFLRILTNNAILGIASAGQANRVDFPANSMMLNGELASHSYSRKPDEASGLTLSPDAKAQVIMAIGNSPTFVCVTVGKARMFVWVTDEVFDVLRPLTAEIEFEQSADQYIPGIIFLRFAFGERCWHNPSLGAGIVIDDPLLRENYGFINFPRLLESARKHGYHITLAFIPWNHWRSRFKQVQMFRRYSDCFSICAHGCDHTANEFRSTDYEGLLRRNFVARGRMERHRERTGLVNEPLMVCPQEQYSSEAMRAFADSRQFVGLINTACMPRNLYCPQICGADLLLPAQDSFYGFPVFKRHYWNGMAVFAMSLFLGKPAVLVEHHEFFRNGSVGAEKFAQGLADLRPDLKWKSLAETVMRTHARRRVSKNKEEVRFFTDTFCLEHEFERPAELRLVRRLPETIRVERVRIGSRDVPFNREDGFLTFETQLQRPETLTVQVDVAPIKPTTCYSPGVRYQASVALRRGLSELRDNIIARNRAALKISRRLMKFLKQTAL
jgi:hypothetical protein